MEVDAVGAKSSSLVDISAVDADKCSDNRDIPPRDLESGSSAPAPKPSLPSAPPLPPTCRDVPGIWSFTPSLGQIGILEWKFKVDTETAEKWGLRMSTTTPAATPASKAKEDEMVDDEGCLSQYQHQHPLPSLFGKSPLCLELLCVSKQNLAENALDSDGLHTKHQEKAENLAERIGTLETSWPTDGSLIVQVNYGQRYGRTCFLRDMVRDSFTLFLCFWDAICDPLKTNVDTKRQTVGYNQRGTRRGECDTLYSAWTFGRGPGVRPSCFGA